MAKDGIQIGRVSAETGLGIDAIRFYEKQGLIKAPPRTEGGFRQFSAGDVLRIKFIRHAQQLGFSLAEVRELLALQISEGVECSHVRDLLRAKVGVIRGKIRELSVLEQQLTKRLRQCERKLKLSGESHRGRCPVLEEIEQRDSHES